MLYDVNTIVCRFFIVGLFSCVQYAHILFYFLYLFARFDLICLARRLFCVNSSFHFFGYAVVVLCSFTLFFIYSFVIIILDFPCVFTFCNAFCFFPLLIFICSFDCCVCIFLFVPHCLIKLMSFCVYFYETAPPKAPFR